MNIRVMIRPVDITELSGALNGLNFFFPGLRRRSAVFLKPKLEKAGLWFGKKALQKKGIDLSLNSLELLVDVDKNTVDGCIIAVEDIDYPQITALLMPDIKEMLAERQDLQPVLEILELLGQDTDKITGGALSVIGPERTEQIIRILLTAYNDRICDVINQKLGKKQDMVRISEIMIL